MSPDAAVASAEPILRLVDLGVTYATPTGSTRALTGVTLDITPGEVVGIVGESGSGKSTIAYATLGHLGANGRVTSGSIRFRGAELVGMRAAEWRSLRGRAIGMVYQDPQVSLNPVYPVGEQIAEGLRHHLGLTPRQAFDRTLAWLSEVNLPDAAVVAKRYPHELSGGQQQRVLIAMAASLEPSLLIMDEPTTGLDTTTQARVLDLIRELQHKHGLSLLYITHDLGVVAELCQRLVVMYRGEVVESGAVREIFHSAAHPYTRHLLAALPRIDRRARLVVADVEAAARDDDRGCAFAPRCRHAEEPCWILHPSLEAVDAIHAVRCHRWSSIDAVPTSPAAESPDEARVGPADDASLLETNGLEKHYAARSGGAGVAALAGIDLRLRQAETLAIIGESGCGKSTLARCVVGLEAPTRGTIRFHGKILAPLAHDRERSIRQALQIVFQNPDASLNPRKSIGEILMRPLDLFGIGASRIERREIAASLLESVQLPAHYLSRYPRQLSGGEKQRVSIARAFATRPALIVCDEPVSSLDVSVQAAVLRLFMDLRRRFDTAYLFISHDLAVVRQIADHIMVIYLGKVCEAGRADQLFAPPFHPYTEALLSAAPVPDPDAPRRHIRLTGPVPSATAQRQGCPFHTRCPRMLGEICRTQSPPAQQLAAGHLIHCHIPVASLAEQQAI